jgi:hypothetical protein
MAFLTTVLQVIRKQVVTSKVAISKEGTPHKEATNKVTTLVATNTSHSLSRELVGWFYVNSLRVTDFFSSLVHNCANLNRCSLMLSFL